MIPQFLGSPPTEGEVEKLRLMLSIYQDGTGQLAAASGRTLPGWRDFQRSVALVFNGVAQESKAVFDVLVPISESPCISYGISCKMHHTLRTVGKQNRVTMEISNLAEEFWNRLGDRRSADLESDPAFAGEMLLGGVEGGYDAVGLDQGGSVDLARSFYLTLQWDRETGRYKFFQFLLVLPDPEDLSWGVKEGRLIATDSDGVVLEWYGYAGGPLRYYPSADRAVWSSEILYLESLPEHGDQYGSPRKVSEYFPDLWGAADALDNVRIYNRNL